MHSALHEGLDPEVAAVLAAAVANGAPELYRLSPAEARARYLLGMSAVMGPAPHVWRVGDTVIPGPGGELTLRLYRPRDGLLPALVFFHGGGWSFGGLDTHDRLCRWLCRLSGCLVAAVDYRLAPEHKFPAAVEDAVAATRWVAQHASAIGVDPARLAVGGDSAGANLAAVVALNARDAGAPAVRFQLLIYPAVDMTMSSPSHAHFGDGYRLTRPQMVWSCANYLRDGGDLLDPRASPLFAEDHSRLPPALIVTAEFDPLRDEGQRYAAALTNRGSAVTYHCEKGMIHGFVGMTGAVGRARTVLSRMATSLRVALSEV